MSLSFGPISSTPRVNSSRTVVLLRAAQPTLSPEGHLESTVLRLDLGPTGQTMRTNLRRVCTPLGRIHRPRVACSTVKVTHRSRSTNYPKYGLGMPSCAGRRGDRRRNNKPGEGVRLPWGGPGEG